MHNALGAIAIVGLIAFAFGERAARVVVGAGLIAATLAALYIGYLVVTDAI